MRVVLVSLVFPHPRRGIFPGVERHIYEYSRALKKRGMQVRVVTTFWNGGTAKDSYEGIEIHRIDDWGTRYGKAGRLFANHVKSFGRNLRLVPHLFSDADVVQAFIALPSTSFLDGSDAPLIATFYHRDKPSRMVERLILPSLFAMEKRFFRDATLTLTFSDSSRDVLIEEYGVPRDAIAVTPLGVDTDKFAPPLAAREKSRGSGGPFRMVFVGALIHRKGIHDLIDALAIVDRERPDWTLVLVGDGRDREALQTRAAALGISGKLVFRGHVDGWGDQLPDLYRQADLFVFPSLKEGFGMVIAEAMACGTAVITTRVSAIPEVVGDTARLVEPSDPKGLALGILELMKDDDRRQRLASAGARRAREQFSWDVVVDRTLEVFERAIRSARMEGAAR